MSIWAMVAQKAAGHIVSGIGAQIDRESHKAQVASTQQAMNMQMIMAMIDLKLEKERQEAARSAMEGRLRQIDEAYGRVGTPEGKRNRAVIQDMIDRVAAYQTEGMAEGARARGEQTQREMRRAEEATGQRGGSVAETRREAAGTGMAEMVGGTAEARAAAESNARMRMEEEALAGKQRAVAPVEMPVIAGSPALQQFMMTSEALAQMPSQHAQQMLARGATGAADIGRAIGEYGEAYERDRREWELEEERKAREARLQSERRDVLREAGYV
jgi:hypothetical protein